MNKINTRFKITLFFFLFSAGLIISFIAIDVFYFSNQLKNTLLKNAVQKIQDREEYLSDSFNISKDILKSVRKSKHFNQYLNNETLFKVDIQDLFITIARNDKNIMQFRYIDVNGFEKVRIDRKNLDTDVIQVYENRLQNKATRYYFKDSKDKELEKVWFSNLDLNMERGKVEMPYKPTLRAMLPIKNKGKFDGIIIINYFMKDVLSKLSKMPLYNFILLNDKGYPLIHYIKDYSWGFYKDNAFSVKKEFHKSFDKIITDKLVQDSSFVSKKLNIPTPEKLIILLKLRKSYLIEQRNDKIKEYILISLIIFAIAMIMSLIFSKYMKEFFDHLLDTQTSNRLLKNEVEEKNIELQKSNDKLKNIIDHIKDFIWEVDRNGIYTYVSPQSEEILGYSSEEMLGKTFFDFMDVNEAKIIKQKFYKILEYQEPIKQLRNINVHKNGSKVYLETSGNPIFDINNNLIGYRGSDRDVTERIKYDEIIEKTNEELKELNKNLEHKVQEEIEKNKEKESQLFAQAKLAAMGDMIGNIAHQWRQPLAIISTIASGIKLQYKYQQLKLEMLPSQMDEIVNKTQHLSQTIDTFRNFLLEEKVYKEIVLQESILSSLKIVDSSLKDNNIKLEKNIAEDSQVKVCTISNELSQVIINIINNAKDAIIERQVQNAWIKIDLVQEENEVCITIEDNAGGIPEEIILRVFEPYFTTKHKSQGTGLGLHMSYKIMVESLKGKIYVKNSDHGAKFFIKLPL